jgi:hypothetical protein
VFVASRRNLVEIGSDGKGEGKIKERRKGRES